MGVFMKFIMLHVEQVLFVCTANTLDTIPGPLLDRMEVIRLSGYASDEKRAIARRYLEPTAASDAGVPNGAASLADSAMELLINEVSLQLLFGGDKQYTVHCIA
jgi:ATP-dependent Lon protease